MRKYLFLLLLIPSVCYGWGSMVPCSNVPGQTASGTYCDGVSWNTLTDFTLDFDHTDDSKNACISGGTETGTLTSATVTTPGTASPLSGGGALYADGSTHKIEFDNSTPYFDSQYGEIKISFNVAAMLSVNQNICYIAGDSDNKFLIYAASNDSLYWLWEDNNAGNKSFYIENVINNYAGDWIQLHIKWDTTRCTDGDGNCADSTANGDWTQAGEDELCMQYRVDDNQDGDFSDGGAENWSSWTCESSTYDYEEWAAEPGNDEVDFGSGSDYDQATYIDDVEISVSQPTE